MWESECICLCFTMTVPSVYTYLSDVPITSLIVLTLFGANCGWTNFVALVKLTELTAVGTLIGLSSAVSSSEFFSITSQSCYLNFNSILQIKQNILINSLLFSMYLSLFLSVTVPWNCWLPLLENNNFFQLEWKRQIAWHESPKTKCLFPSRSNPAL